MTEGRCTRRRHRRPTRVRCTPRLRCATTLPGAALLLAALAAPVRAEDADFREVLQRVGSAIAPVGIEGGAVEAGVSGTIVSAGTTSLSVGWRLGTFLAAGPGLLGAEGSVGWARIAELDRLELLGGVSWSPVSEGAVLPYAAALGGMDQEWVGSFSDRRGLVGAGVGLRSLVGRRALIRTEYRYLRALDDGVDRSYHVVEFGLSLLFRNELRLTG